jgi:hypothetical protein
VKSRAPSVSECLSAPERVDLADAPIEAVAKLLAAVARPCECERSAPDPETCVGPPDRWERRWAEGACDGASDTAKLSGTRL